MTREQGGAQKTVKKWRFLSKNDRFWAVFDPDSSRFPVKWSVFDPITLRFPVKWSILDPGTWGFLVKSAVFDPNLWRFLQKMVIFIKNSSGRFLYGKVRSGHFRGFMVRKSVKRYGFEPLLDPVFRGFWRIGNDVFWRFLVQIHRVFS